MKIHKSLAFVAHLLPQEVVIKALKKSIKAGFKDSKHALKDLIIYATAPKSGPAPILPPVQTIATVTAILPKENAPAMVISEEASGMQSKLLGKIPSVWEVAITLDVVTSLYSPFDIPQESIAYPLFSYGTKILKLEGMFKFIPAGKPSDFKNKMLQPLFVVGRTARITARSFYAFQWMCGYMQRKVYSNSNAKTVRQQLRKAHDELATTVRSVGESQHALVTQAQNITIDQTAFIDHITRLSAEKQELVVQCLRKIQTLLSSPETPEAQLEKARLLIAQLIDELKADTPAP